MSTDIEVIVGTYSDYLLGYRLMKKELKGEANYLFQPTFTDGSHAGSLRCLAIQGHLVASGGYDDRIFIYDMRTRSQTHIVQTHNSTVNSVVFTQDLSHLLSGDADGRMVATRVSDWQTAGDWGKSHGGNALTRIACHPTNRLALSLGNDNKLNTWNLVKGRVVYRTNLNKWSNLGKFAHSVAWSTDGKHFALIGRQGVEMWDIDSARVVRYTETSDRTVCLAWVSATDCIVGLENGFVIWASLSNEPDAKAVEISVHDTRVKAMAFLNGILVTISSCGEINAWRCSLEDQKLTLLATTKIALRPTCMGVVETRKVNVPAPPLSKQAEPTSAAVSDDEEEEEEEEDDEDDDDESHEQPKPRGFVSVEYDADQTAVNQPKKSQNRKRKDSSSSSEETSLPEPTLKRTKQALAKQSKVKKFKTVDSSDGSSEEEDTDDSFETYAKSVAKPQPAAESDSDSEDDDDDDEDTDSEN